LVNVTTPVVQDGRGEVLGFGKFDGLFASASQQAPGSTIGNNLCHIHSDAGLILDNED
jgi:hypothetical protein